MGFRVDISGFMKNVSETELKTRAAIALMADTGGKKLEAEAKLNAPWQDQSSKARDTIVGGYEWVGDVCSIFVCGNMEYSPYLELCNEKKYAILWPTVLKLHPEILRGFHKILDKR